MKVGQKVFFYTERVVKSASGEKVYTKQFCGTLVRFDDLICEVVPDGKSKAVVLPRTQVREA